jgi:SAM-dependent methyltransferase
VASGRVLDVGCGPVNKIPDQFTPFGIEIEKAAAEVADGLMRQRGGRVAHAPAIEGFAQFKDNWFDGVIMRSYLEHEMKPREVLEAARAKLRKGGVIYVKVPNFGTLNRQVRGVDWCGFRFPDHLNYFDVAGLRRMAEATGYRFELRNRLTRFTNDNMHTFLTRL